MKIIVSVIVLFLTTTVFGQNIGINTDGSTAETGLMLDVKGTNSFSVTATQNIFQVKSFDASGSELKLRMILGTHATAGSRYAGLEVYDAAGAAYRHLIFQPSGGSVGIGTTAPAWLFTTTNSGAAASTEYVIGAFNQVTSLGGAYFGYYTDGTGTAMEARIRSGASKELALGTTSYPRAIYVLNASGYVGVGSTTAPTSRLEVFNGELTIRAGSTFPDDPGDIIFKTNGGTQKARIWSSSVAATSLNMNGDGTGTAALHIDASANVGIGNVAPGEKLHVTGNIRASSLAGTGTVLTQSDANGTLARSNLSGLIPPLIAMDIAHNFTPGTNNPNHCGIMAAYVPSTGKVYVISTNYTTNIENMDIPSGTVGCEWNIDGSNNMVWVDFGDPNGAGTAYVVAMDVAVSGYENNDQSSSMLLARMSDGNLYMRTTNSATVSCASLDNTANWSSWVLMLDPGE